MCIIVGDRVVIDMCSVSVATSILHESIIQLYFFLPILESNLDI